MPIPKIDPKKIFASQAPSQDVPAEFNNYERGWDESRKNNGKPTIKQFNKLQQLTDEKILWMHQNGAALPFDEAIEYADGAVVVKDGELQQLKEGVWVDVFKVTKEQLGLGNVDNTSDMDKPISLAAQEALDLKANQDYVDGALTALSTNANKYYPTLAAATADIANIAVNSPVQIGEAANGGLWVKETAGATSLTKSAYDPLTQAKTDATTKANAAEANAKAYVNANDGATRYDSSAFYEAKYYNMYGTVTASANAASTDLIPVKAGDEVSVFTKVNSSTYPAILVYNSSGTFVRSVVPSVFSTPTETITTIEADGFVRSQWMAGGTPLTDKDGVAKVVINEGSKRFLTDALLPNAAAPLLAVKADKYQAANIDTSSIVLGGVGNTGLETASNLRARLPVFKLNAGDVVEISRPVGSAFQFGWNTAATNLVPFNAGLFKGGTTYQFTIDSGLKYVRIVFRKNPESEITALDLETIKSQVIIKVNDKVIYGSDLEKLETRIVNLENEPVHTFNSNYRASSEATGGLVSFIDDDGKAELYTVLNPLFKSLGAPYASAIVPTNIDKENFLTLNQLKELAADTYNFETMNHTFSHQNLSNLTAPEIHDQIKQAKLWLRDNGFLDDGFVLPYGGDNALVRKIVAQYYNSCYDFSSNSTLFLTFDNIQNALIKRTDFGLSATRLADHKAIIDNISANGGWVVITTHVLNAGYWDSNSAADLTELINYIRAKGCKIVTPRDGFQIMGNLVENDSGFKIAANGKIFGAS